MALTLIIGNRNYSSWSLRPWLAMKVAGIDFTDRRVLLDRPETKSDILRYSPSGKVPCLVEERSDLPGGSLVIWDSLAICEYVNEAHADDALWPREMAPRARARAVAAEMHSGFSPLRTHMPMDIRSRLHERGQRARSRDDVARDIERVQQLWRDCLERSGGPLLFGEFSIADAMFAPVVTRFVTYGVELPSDLGAYSDRVLALPAMRQWCELSAAETEVLPNL
jgi:glutathione S-transferase